MQNLEANIKKIFPGRRVVQSIGGGYKCLEIFELTHNEIVRMSKEIAEPGLASIYVRRSGKDVVVKFYPKNKEA